MDIKDKICNVLLFRGGMKIIDLVTEVVEIYEEREIIEEMVLEGKIVEIEYTLPDCPYKTKFYLPGGSIVDSVRGTPSDKK